MAVNLVLDNNPDFSASATNELPSQEWGFYPSVPWPLNEGDFLHTVNSLIGQPNPVDIPVQTQIKTYNLPEYSNIYVSIGLQFVTNPNISWLQASGPLAAATGNGYLLTPNNLDVTTTLSFTNLEVLPQGNHLMGVHHYVKGELPGGLLETIERKTYFVILKRLGYNEVSIFPENLSFAHVIGQTLPAGKQITLYANDAFTVKVSEHFNLTGGNIALESTISGVKTYSGTNTQTVTLTPEASIEMLGEQVAPPYTATVEISNTFGSLFLINVPFWQWATASFLITPQALSFFAVQGISESPAQIIEVRGHGSYTVQKPSWLNLIVYSGNLGNGNSNIGVQPISSGNLVEGIYQGLIIFQTANGNIEINVSYTVARNYNFNLSLSELNFTKDLETVSNFYHDDNYNVNIDLEVKSFAYKTQFLKLINSSFKRSIFNNKTSFYFGKSIEKVMYDLDIKEIGVNNLTNGSLTNIFGGQIYPYYNPSLSRIEVSFINRNTGLQEGSTRILNNIKFVKGRKPNRYKTTYGFIDYLEKPIRVTNKSSAILNIYAKNKAAVVKLYKNGTFLSSFNASSQISELFGLVLNFTNFTKGDVVEVRTYKSGFDTVVQETEFVSQKYIVFPEGKYSYHIGWEDEHGLLSLLEFTGDYNFSTTHNEIISTQFADFLDVIKKYPGTRELLFNANTGWLLKVNQERIESLLNAKKAWIIFKENKSPISLVPKAKKINRIDSEQENYDFNIQFRINPNNALENNTF